MIFTKPVLNFIRKYYSLQPQGWFVQGLTILHSGILAIYSGWTAYYSIAIVGSFILESGGGFEGLKVALCDNKRELWVQHNLSCNFTCFLIVLYPNFFI